MAEHAHYVVTAEVFEKALAEGFIKHEGDAIPVEQWSHPEHDDGCWVPAPESQVTGEAPVCEDPER